MIDLPYGFRVRLACPFDVAVRRAIDALADAGLAVATTVDVRHIVAAERGHDFRPYLILGVSSPMLIARALEAELEAGLLVTCDVVVYADGPDRSVVAAVAPLLMAEATGHNLALTDVAREAEVRLRRALGSLEGVQFHAA